DSSESRAKSKNPAMSDGWCFWRRDPGRQKGLVDHVDPAKFSYLQRKRKVPLTIANLSSASTGPWALAAFVSRF
ncbi:MAG: hypothetical protein ABWY82_01950, partial [Tardiphaga sp.]